MANTALLLWEHFSRISIDDPFFDTLKIDYLSFQSWFESKCGKPDSFACTLRNQTTGQLEGFLYIKSENGLVADVVPALEQANRLKIGTFKVNPHGTRLGERFIKRAFDVALAQKVQALYVTVFAKHGMLVDLFMRYGFTHVATKPGHQDHELVLERRLDQYRGDVVLDYPRFPIRNVRHYVLSLYPEWHSRLLPDSILKNESTDILEDVSHSNSIHKIYLTSMRGIENIRRGDTLLIYRTKDGGSAYHTSVVTSLCVVEELVNISNFNSQDEFLRYCESYSIFSRKELILFFSCKKYPWIIKFTYNLALTKRPNRKNLIEDVNLNPALYWGFFEINIDQLKKILKLSNDYEKARTLVYPS